MQYISKNLIFVALGTAIIAGSFGFCNTIEASPHKNIVRMNDKDQRPPEPPHQRYHRYHRHHEAPEEYSPRDDDHRRPEHPPQYTLRYDHGRLDHVPQDNHDRTDHPMMHQ